MRVTFLFAVIGSLLGWVSAQGQSYFAATIRRRQQSGMLVVNYSPAASSSSFIIPTTTTTTTIRSSSPLTRSPATSSTCPATITKTVYPPGVTPTTTSAQTSTYSPSSSASPSNIFCSSPAAADANPQCPDSAGETAITLNQFYRVICGGYYGASILLSNTTHPSPYPLSSCVDECVNYNTAGMGASTGTGNCSMVVLEPPSSGAGRSGFNCFSFAGLVSEDFAAANTLDWASGVLLSSWEASQALCAPGPSL